MATVFTVQADLTGNAASLIAASKLGSKAINDFKKSAEDANGSFGKMGEGLGAAVSRGVSGVEHLIGAVAKIGVAAVAAGGVAVGALALKGAQAGLDRLMAIQDSTVALTRMLGSAAAAADLTGKALKIVQGTPFAFPQFAEATRTLVAFGVSAQKVPGVLQAIADSAAASGRGTEAVGSLTQAFADLQVQGKVSGQILQQLATSGVNGLGILANAYGKSTADMQDMISKGMVPAGEAMDALVKGIEQGSHGIAGDFNAIGGAAQDLGSTVSGSLGNVKAAFARMGASWLKPFQDDLPKVLNNGVIPLLDKLGVVGQTAMKKLADTGLLDKAMAGLQSLQKHADDIIPTIRILGDVFSPLTLVFKALQQAMPDVQGSLVATGQRVGSTLVPAIADLLKALVPILPLLGEIVSAFSRGLVGVLPMVTGMISGLLGVLEPIVGFMNSLPTPILAVGVALLGLSKAGVPVGDMLMGLWQKFTDLGSQWATVTDGLSSGGGKFRAAASEMGGFKAALGAAADFMTGPWGIAIGAAVAGIGTLIATSLPQAAKNVDELTASLDRNTGAFTNATKASVYKALHDSGAIEAANKLHINLDDLTQAAMGNAEASKRVNDQMVEASKVFEQQRAAGEKTILTDVEMGGAIKSVGEALGGQVAAINSAVQNSENWLKATGAAKAAQEALKGSLDSYSSAVSANTVNTDVNSAAYKANVVALNDVAQKSKDYITTVENQYHSTQKTTQAQDEMSNTVYAAAIQMGMSSQAAIDYTSKILGIPKSAVTTAVANTDAARTKLDGLETAVNRLDGRVVTVYAQANIAAAQAALDNLRANSMIQANLYATGAAYQKANGGIMEHGAEAFANGGMMAFAGGGSLASGIYSARNPGIIKFAEPETRWEAYISGKPGQEERNVGVALKALQKLGVNLNHLGGGQSGSLNVTNNIYGTDPAVTAKLIEQGVVAQLGL